MAGAEQVFHSQLRDQIFVEQFFFHSHGERLRGLRLQTGAQRDFLNFHYHAAAWTICFRGKLQDERLGVHVVETDQFINGFQLG